MNSGSLATSIIIITANTNLSVAGDSRCLFSRTGEGYCVASNNNLFSVLGW